MKKNIFGWLLAVPAFLGMVSCQNEEVAESTINNIETERVVLKLTASLDADKTRATLTPDGKTLKAAWELNDKIEVFTTEGKWVGQLTVYNVHEDDNKQCDFSGPVDLPKTDSRFSLVFYYMGENELTKEDHPESEGFIGHNFPIDFSSQNGSADSFNKYDILKATHEYANLAAAKNTLGRVDFERNFSFGYFVLKHGDEKISLSGKNVKVYASEGTLYNKATLKFTNHSYEYASGDIQITGCNSEEFYLNLMPSENVHLTFTYEDGEGNTFIGSTKSAWNLKGGTYYTLKDTQGEAIPIVMRNDNGSDDEKTFEVVYHENYDDNTSASVKAENVTAAEYTHTVLAYTASELNSLTERTYYTFSGWNAVAEGNGTTYAAGSTLTLKYNTETKEKTITANLYAQWTWSSYQIKFAKNPKSDETGEGPEAINGNVDNGNAGTITLPTDAKFEKTGHKFIGWTTEPNGKTVITDTSNLVSAEKPEITLYPVWEEDKSGVGVIAPVAPGDEL